MSRPLRASDHLAFIMACQHLDTTPRARFIPNPLREDAEAAAEVALSYRAAGNPDLPPPVELLSEDDLSW